MNARQNLNPKTAAADAFAREVRDLISRPLSQRKQYLTEVTAMRGEDAADALRDAMAALFVANNPGVL